MEIRPIVSGLATYVPGNQFLRAKKGGGGTLQARYCYNVWLKHLSLLRANGLDAIPVTLGELGPGGSLGVGLAAMLSGVDHYVALDVVKHANCAANLKVLDDLVDLFKARTPKQAGGWPDVEDYLDAKGFAGDILTDEWLAASLADERVEKIRRAVKQPGNGDPDLSIEYVVPWSDPAVMEEHSIDAIISHSVLEHVTDLEMSYQAMASWLKPGGFMSHQVDLSAHGITKEWNGHRQFSETVWKLIVGARPYLINREPCSRHHSLLKKYGFIENCYLKNHAGQGIARAQLAARWKNLSDDDFSCRGFYYAGQQPA